jgi:hypothetical protein
MARSDYIYILQNNDGTIMAARTVKHELVGWIKHKCGWSRSLLEKNCHFIRFSDGCPSSEPFYYEWGDIP